MYKKITSKFCKKQVKKGHL